MPRIFVYEHLTGSGGDCDADMLAQGRAMRDALVTDLAAVAHVIVTFAASHHERDARAANTAIVRARPGETAADFVRRLAERNDWIWVIAPETGGILAELHTCAGAAGWIGCDIDAIRIAASKRATTARLRALGIPATRTIDGDDAAAREARFVVKPGGGDSAERDARFVVKPDEGAGARDTRVYRHLADALAERSRREAAGEPAIVERWEEGTPLSMSLLCAANRVEVLSVNRQRIDVDSAGNVHYIGVDVDAVGHRSGDRFHALARDVARALPGLRGYVGIDLVLRATGEPVVVEVNPRVTCAYVGLSAAIGRNVARDVLDLHRSDAAPMRSARGDVVDRA